MEASAEVNAVIAGVAANAVSVAGALKESVVHGRRVSVHLAGKANAVHDHRVSVHLADKANVVHGRKVSVHKVRVVRDLHAVHDRSVHHVNKANVQLVHLGLKVLNRHKPGRRRKLLPSYRFRQFQRLRRHSSRCRLHLRRRLPLKYRFRQFKRLRELSQYCRHHLHRRLPIPQIPEKQAQLRASRGDSSHVIGTVTYKVPQTTSRSHERNCPARQRTRLR